MDKHIILLRVFRTSLLVIMPVILLACLLCNWPVVMILFAMAACMVISSAGTLSLQINLWLFQRTRFAVGFMWMLILASIPLISLMVASFSAAFVPGRTWLILLLATMSGYFGLFANSLSVSKLFNSFIYGRGDDSSND
jgi:hypothetical protein